MKIIKTTLVAGLISLFATFSTFAEKVKIGDPGWTGATAIANLLAAVVNDKMGGEAELVPGNNTAIYAAIDRSKGEIEVHPDIWLPNQQAYTNDLVPKGTLKLSSKPYEGNQGYCVSQQFAKKMNITAIEDLARPEVVKAMDSDGNGKGEFWIGADGWASANVNRVKLRDYGLYDAGIEAIRAAGGLKKGADTSDINQARIMRDGEQIYVYAATTSSGGVAKRVVRKNGPVMINRATVKEFEALDGIGPVLANRIVAYRKINGPFTVIEDVMKVSGIGAGTFAKFKEKLRV